MRSARTSRRRSGTLNGSSTHPREGCALTEAQRAAPTYRELAWDGAAVASAARREGDYGARLVAELAEAAADLLTSPAIATVRQCDGPGFVVLFLPAHPRRSWCSPKPCGNRVRVARYYQRHKVP